MRKYIIVLSEAGGIGGPYLYRINIDKIVYVRERYDGRCFIELDGGNGIDVNASATEIMKRIANAIKTDSEEEEKCQAR